MCFASKSNLQRTKQLIVPSLFKGKLHIHSLGDNSSFCVDTSAGLFEIPDAFVILLHDGFNGLVIKARGTTVPPAKR